MLSMTSTSYWAIKKL